MLTKSFFMYSFIYLLTIFLSCNSSKKNIDYNYLLETYLDNINQSRDTIFVILNQDIPSLGTITRNGFDSIEKRYSSSIIALSPADFNDNKNVKFIKSASTGLLDYHSSSHPKILSITNALYIEHFNKYFVETKYLCGIECGGESLFVFETFKDKSQKVNEIALGEY